MCECSGCTRAADKNCRHCGKGFCGCCVDADTHGCWKYQGGVPHKSDGAHDQEDESYVQRGGSDL